MTSWRTRPSPARRRGPGCCGGTGSRGAPAARRPGWCRSEAAPRPSSEGPSATTRAGSASPCSWRPSRARRRRRAPGDAARPAPPRARERSDGSWGCDSDGPFDTRIGRAHPPVRSMSLRRIPSARRSRRRARVRRRSRVGVRRDPSRTRPSSAHVPQVCRALGAQTAIEIIVGSVTRTSSPPAIVRHPDARGMTRVAALDALASEGELVWMIDGARVVISRRPAVTSVGASPVAIVSAKDDLGGLLTPTGAAPVAKSASGVQLPQHGARASGAVPTGGRFRRWRAYDLRMILALDQGHDELARHRVRPRRAGGRRGTAGVPADLPAAGLGRARRRGDLEHASSPWRWRRWRRPGSRRVTSPPSASRTSARRPSCGTAPPAGPC